MTNAMDLQFIFTSDASSLAIAFPSSVRHFRNAVFHDAAVFMFTMPSLWLTRKRSKSSGSMAFEFRWAFSHSFIVKILSIVRPSVLGATPRLQVFVAITSSCVSVIFMTDGVPVADGEKATTHE